MAEHGPYKNAEGYVDPTAAQAIKGMAKPGEIWAYKGREVLIVKNQGGYSNILTLSINPGKDKNTIQVAGRYTTPGKLNYAFNDQLTRRVETLRDPEFQEILCEITSILFFNPNSMMLANRTDEFKEEKKATEIKKLKKKLEVLRGMYDDLLNRFLCKESEYV